MGFLELFSLSALQQHSRIKTCLQMQVVGFEQRQLTGLGRRSSVCSGPADEGLVVDVCGAGQQQHCCRLG